MSHSNSLDHSKVTGECLDRFPDTKLLFLRGALTRFDEILAQIFLKVTQKSRKSQKGCLIQYLHANNISVISVLSV